MKLCKDCKHAVWPSSPLQSFSGATFYTTAMCSHPDAGRSVVTGALSTTCADARGDTVLSSNGMRKICGMNAGLFEQAPEPEPLKMVEIKTWETPKETWFDRLGAWILRRL